MYYELLFENYKAYHSFLDKSFEQRFEPYYHHGNLETGKAVYRCLDKKSKEIRKRIELLIEKSEDNEKISLVERNNYCPDWAAHEMKMTKQMLEDISTDYQIKILNLLKSSPEKPKVCTLMEERWYDEYFNEDNLVLVHYLTKPDTAPDWADNSFSFPIPVFLNNDIFEIIKDRGIDKFKEEINYGGDNDLDKDLEATNYYNNWLSEVLPIFEKILDEDIYVSDRYIITYNINIGIIIIPIIKLSNKEAEKNIILNHVFGNDAFVPKFSIGKSIIKLVKLLNKE